MKSLRLTLFNRSCQRIKLNHKMQQPTALKEKIIKKKIAKATPRRETFAQAHQLAGAFSYFQLN